jgi:hypothetical protein
MWVRALFTLMLVKIFVQTLLEEFIITFFSRLQFNSSTEYSKGPALWSSGQSSWLQIKRSRVRFPALPDFFLRSSGSGTGSTQSRENN